MNQTHLFNAYTFGYELFLVLSLVCFGLSLFFVIQITRGARKQLLDPTPKWLVIGAAILAGILFVVLNFLIWDWSQVLMSCALAGWILLSLPYPGVASLMFVAYLFLRPWELIPQEKVLLSLPRGMAAMTLASFGLHLILRKEKIIHWNLFLSLFAAFGFWILASSLGHTDRSEIQQSFFDFFLRVAVVIFLLFQTVRNAFLLDLFKKTIFYSTLCIAILSLVKKYYDSLAPQLSQSLDTSRLEFLGLIANSNDLSAVVIMGLAIGAGPLINSASFKEAVQNLHNWIWISFLFLGIIIVSNTESRGAALGLLSLIPSYLLMKSKLKSKLLLGILSFLLLVVASSLQFTRDSEDLTQSSQSRLNYWITGVHMYLKNPILGVGFNQFPRNYESYSIGPMHEFGERAAHSSWIQVLAETGTPGIILFIALFAWVLGRAWQGRGEHPELFMALVAYTITMSLLSHAYLIYPYILWTLIALTTCLKQSPTKLKLPGSKSVVLGIAFLLILPSNAVASNQTPLVIEPSTNKLLPEKTWEPRKDIKLEGARGEDVSFQIRIDGQGTKSSCNSLEISLPQNFNHQIFEQVFYNAQKKSSSISVPGKYPDALVPINTQRLCLKAGDRIYLWVDVNIPRNAQSGEFKGKVSFGKHNTSINLKIWNLTMPLEPSLPIYSELITWYLLLAHYGKWQEGEENLAQSYATLMRQHRVFPIKFWIKRPEVKNEKLDLGSSIDSQSFSALRLNKSLDPIVDFPSFTPQTSEADWIKYLKALEQTLQINEEVKERSLIYLFDEPKDTDLARIKRFAKLTKTYAPSVRIMLTTPPRKDLEDTIDIFTPLLNKVPLQKGNSKPLWGYISCMSHGCTGEENDLSPDLVIDRPSTYVRSIGWISANLRLDAFLYYSVNNQFQTPGKNLFVDQWDSFTGHGDGNLIYPGKLTGRNDLRDKPIASVRLKLLRQTSYDHQYLSWLKQEKLSPELKTRIQKIAESGSRWSKRFDDYENLRSDIGNFLDKRKSGANP